MFFRLENDSALSGSQGKMKTMLPGDKSVNLRKAGWGRGDVNTGGPAGRLSLFLIQFSQPWCPAPADRPGLYTQPVQSRFSVE